MFSTSLNLLGFALFVHVLSVTFACEDNWILHDHRCYIIAKDSFNRSNAIESCQQTFKANLWAPKDPTNMQKTKAEVKFVFDEARKGRKKSYIHVAFKRHRNSSKFNWKLPENKDVLFTVDYPAIDDGFSRNLEKKCGLFFTKGNRSTQKDLIIVNLCSMPARYICVKSANPTKSPIASAKSSNSEIYTIIVIVTIIVAIALFIIVVILFVDVRKKQRLLVKEKDSGVQSAISITANNLPSDKQ